MLIKYKELARELRLEPLGHQPSILLTLVLFLRVEVSSPVEKDLFL